MAACQSSVADGFFQTDNSVVNDFPRLVPSGRGDSVRWSVAAGSAGNNAGCDTFVAQQNRLAAQVASSVGYALDENGNLVVAPSGAAYTTGRSVSDLSYGSWTAKAASGYTLVGSYGGTSDNSYLARADGHTENRRDRRAISPDTATWTVPAGSSSTGNFGSSWHGTTVVTTITVPGYYSTPPRYRILCVGGVWTELPSGARGCNGEIRRETVDFGVWVPESTRDTESDVRVALGNVAYHLTKAKSVALCPSLFHPRGEDSYQRIGRSTGRSLTGLSHAVGRTADRFWCRSDLRYERKFKAEHHTGVTEAQRHPQARNMAAGTVFSAYGRLGCYYTATAPKLIKNSARAYECGYRFPMPRCDSNKDGIADREYTAAEVQSLVDRGTIALGQRVSLADTARCDPPNPPPTQASFTADACVTADLEIYENRIVGSAAEPGVPASDRTLVVAAGRTAWDLDVTSPHPLTASPPRDAAAGSGDPDGCADGSEDRADHASAPGDAARSQSPSPSYAASIRTDTAVPPNDADGDINYRGATRGMAHRYASLVAENTCAVKLAEAEAELALLEAREDAFAQWLTDYKAAADRYVTDAASYSRTPQQSGSGLAILRFNDQEANKETYAALLSTRYAALSAALTAAKTAYDTATDRTAGPNRADVIQAASDRNCVSHYDNEISRLKRLFQSAETSALGNGASGIKEERNAVNSTRLVVPAAITTTTTINAYTVPDIAAVESRSERYTECLDHEYSGGCWSIPQDETCTDADRCPGRTRVVVTRYYTCPGGSYTVSGSVSGRYGTATRTGSFSTTYAAAGRGESTSASCPGFVAQQGGTVVSDAGSYVRGTPASASSLPSAATVSAAATLRTLGKASLLGSYYPSHADRGNLTATADSDRRTAGRTLVAAAGTVPAGSPDAVVDYREDYTTAYDTAFRRAAGHMSGSVWNNFDWKYAANTLLWSNYAEDPATSFSASTATPRDGTGCDLIAVASDGTVSVEATRLDYETSSYGKGSVYSARTDAQRTCKIRRTRTPELLLEYQPSRPSGTDASKAVSSFYVNYQPPVAAGQTAAERFKLYDEAEVFAVKTSLADSPPVFCGTTLPADGYLSHTAGQMPSVPALIAKDSWRSAAQLTTTVLRPTSNPPAVTEDHCFARPRLTATDKPRLIVFDDTAHSDMNLVYLQKDPDDTTGINLFTGGAFTKYALETYQYPGDNNQQSVFYGAIWEPPANDYAV